MRYEVFPEGGRSVSGERVRDGDKLDPRLLIPTWAPSPHLIAFTAIITLNLAGKETGGWLTLSCAEEETEAQELNTPWGLPAMAHTDGKPDPALWSSSPPRCPLWERPPGSPVLIASLRAGPCSPIASSDAGPLLRPDFPSEIPPTWSMCHGCTSPSRAGTRGRKVRQQGTKFKEVLTPCCED